MGSDEAQQLLGKQKAPQLCPRPPPPAGADPDFLIIFPFPEAPEAGKNT